MRILLKSGADAKQTDQKGQTAFDLAKENKSIRVLLAPDDKDITDVSFSMDDCGGEKDVGAVLPSSASKLEARKIVVNTETSAGLKTTGSNVEPESN